MRIEPPPSFACASGTIPAATAAAEPPLDPPVEWSVFHGFRHGPRKWDSQVGRIPSSGVLLLPTTTSPARFCRTTSSLSWSGTNSRLKAVPEVCRTPP
jgi:hypothetical protein